MLTLFKVGRCLAWRVQEGRLSTSTSLKWTVVLGGDHDPSIGITLSVRMLTHQELPSSVGVATNCHNSLRGKILIDMQFYIIFLFFLVGESSFSPHVKGHLACYIVCETSITMVVKIMKNMVDRCEKVYI